jgi:hypothetical protein
MRSPLAIVGLLTYASSEALLTDLPSQVLIWIAEKWPEKDDDNGREISLDYSTTDRALDWFKEYDDSQAKTQDRLQLVCFLHALGFHGADGSPVTLIPAKLFALFESPDHRIVEAAESCIAQFSPQDGVFLRQDVVAAILTEIGGLKISLRSYIALLVFLVRFAGPADLPRAIAMSFNWALHHTMTPELSLVFDRFPLSADAELPDEVRSRLSEDSVWETYAPAKTLLLVGRYLPKEALVALFARLEQEIDTGGIALVKIILQYGRDIPDLLLKELADTKMPQTGEVGQPAPPGSDNKTAIAICLSALSGYTDGLEKTIPGGTSPATLTICWLKALKFAIVSGNRSWSQAVVVPVFLLLKSENQAIAHAALKVITRFANSGLDWPEGAGKSFLDTF